MSFYHNHKGIHIILIMITINATMAFSQSRVDLAVGVGNAVGMSERGLHLDATLYVGPQMEMHKGALDCMDCISSQGVLRMHYKVIY